MLLCLCAWEVGRSDIEAPGWGDPGPQTHFMDGGLAAGEDSLAQL